MFSLFGSALGLGGASWKLLSVVEPPTFFFIADEMVGSVSLLGVQTSFLDGVLRPRSLGGLIFGFSAGYANSFGLARMENFEMYTPFCGCIFLINIKF
jgi:hypothetical protein